MSRLSKLLSTIALCFLLSVISQQMVATSGYSIGGSVNKSALKANVGIVYSESEWRLEQEKAEKAHDKAFAQYKALSGIEKHQFLKAASWQYTWFPWLIMGLVIRLKSVSEWGIVMLPLGILALFQLVWLREILLIAMAISVSSLAKLYLVNWYNQLLNRTP